MALKGTLKDFGIADILQLIGQQQKTGVLYIKSRSEEVEVSFISGLVARALSKTRRSRELLGAMLVRSGLISQEQLGEALEVQKRTLKRLGDILVTEGTITADQLREMTQLQTTETLYKLFGWKTGSYEFVQQDVEADPAQGPPIRPESILMEGMRRVDEWPMVRKRVPSNDLALERLKHLDPPPLGPGAGLDDVDAAFDAVLDSARNPATPVPRSVGRNERTLYKLADPNVPIADLVDLSRLGEFETCKAIFNLIEAGYLKTVTPSKKVHNRTRTRLISAELGQVVRRGLAQMSVGVVLVVLFAVAARSLGTAPRSTTLEVQANTGTLQRVVADAQLARLSSALEVYRLSNGKYPDELGALMESGILGEGDLKHPYSTRYHYRLTDSGYVLLPPVE